jgi:hypothetical protein
VEALGGISSPAGSCVWHVVGLQRSVREWAIRQGWGGRPVRHEQAQGILVAALGVLAAHDGRRNAKAASKSDSAKPRARLGPGGLALRAGTAHDRA